MEVNDISGFRALDWGVVAGYFVAMLAIGGFYSRRTRTADDYLVGGRNMNSSVIGLSLFATLLSAVTYLATPAEIIEHGPVTICYLAATPLVFVVVGYLLIPHLMKLPVTSAYEILEGRLGLRIRLLGALIFLLTRLVWMALIIYMTTEKVIVVVMDWPAWTTPFISIALGVITVAYTSMGGFRAVVLTDVIQTFILFAGAILTIGVVTRRLGGVSAWWPTEWAPTWDRQPFFSWDPRVRITVVGTVLQTFLWWICTAGSDQMAIQRYLATRNARAARHAFLITSVSDFCVTLLLALLGFALLGFYSANPQQLPDGPRLAAQAGRLFPHFILHHLPQGVAGLVVCGLLAAAMSSLSSGQSSVSAVITADFVDRFRKKTPADGGNVGLARLVSVCVGCGVVLISLLLPCVPGNLFEVTVKTTHLFIAPLFGLFFMALFVPFATPFGAAVGTVYGLAAAFRVGFGDVLTGAEPISFQWMTTVSLAAGVAAGCLFSLLPTRGKSWPVLLGWSALAVSPLIVAGLYGSGG